MTTEYSHVNGGSGTVLTREEWLAWIRDRREEIDAGKLVVRVYRIEDLAVRVYGDSAVVTGVAHSTGERQGSPFTSRVRFTNLWVLDDGEWRRAAFHDSPLPAATSSGADDRGP